MSFHPGLELSRRFYWETVRPILDQCYPALPHAAAMLGPGSEVLGFDTEMSMDHDWYPNVLLFLREPEAGLKGPIKELLRQQLPHTFLGFAVDSAESPDEENIQVMQPVETGPVNHNVFLVTVRQFFQRRLDWDITQPLQARAPALLG